MAQQLTFKKIGFFIGILCTLIGTLSNAVFPILLRKLIDGIANSESTNIVVYVLVFVFIIQSIFNFLGIYILSKVGIDAVAKIREKFLSTVFNSKLKFLDNISSGELSSRIINDTSSIHALISTNFPNLISSVFSITLVIVLLISIDMQLTIFLVILTLPLIVFFSILGKKIERQSFLIQQGFSRLNKTLIQGVINIRQVKADNKEVFVIKDVSDINDSIRNSGYKSVKLVSITQIGFSTTLSMIIISVLILGAAKIQEGILSIGGLIAYLALVLQIVSPLIALGEFWANYHQAKGSMKELIKILNYELEQTHGEDLPSNIEELEFRNVSYGYSSDRICLNRVNFTIKKGEVLLIQGNNGTGKSTLTYLIERFYTPNYGSIWINKTKEMSSYDLKEWRKKIGYVSQESFLMSGSIKDYLTDGLQKVPTKLELKKICAKLDILDFIECLPDTFNYPIQELGKTFSGGQKQKLNMVRVLLHDPEIYIFDESLANTDKTFHKIFKRVINELKADKKIVIIISHQNIGLLQHTEKVISL